MARKHLVPLVDVALLVLLGEVDVDLLLLWRESIPFVGNLRMTREVDGATMWMIVVELREGSSSFSLLNISREKKL